MTFPPLSECTVVDLRSDAARQAEPLPAVRLVVLSLDAIEDGQHSLKPEHGPLLVVCERGPRSSLAARYLRADGLQAEHWQGTPQELKQALEPPSV